MGKKGFCFIFLLVTFLFISSTGWADIIINSVSLDPLEPTTEDSITVSICGSLTSTCDTAFYIGLVKYDDLLGNHCIDLFLSHLIYSGICLPLVSDFQIEVELGELEQGIYNLRLIIVHIELTFPPQIDTTIDASMSFVVQSTSVSEEIEETISVFSLSQNYPNPFNPETKISYNLPQGCHVKLTIYNIQGQEVRGLVDGRQSVGLKKILWDGKDENGNKVASGIYFYQLKAEGFTEIKKMILLK